MMMENPYYEHWGSEEQALDAGQKNTIMRQALEKLQHLSLGDISETQILQESVSKALDESISRLGFAIQAQEREELQYALVGRLAGYEYLMPLFRRDDLSEICLTPNGKLWIMKKGLMDFELIHEKVDAMATQRVIEALLRANNKSISEAVPIISAKISRTPEIPAIRGGARVHIVHQCLCTEGGPSINIRFFEPRPVSPQQLIAWHLAPANVITSLLDAVSKGARVMVIGGTASGKTTTLAALCHGIPAEARIVKIEDPEEIWLDRKNLTTMVARPALSGAAIRSIQLADCVDSAMRMTPQWLILGEVRDGLAAQALFRAQMSDHPGLSTFHAQNPAACVQRLVNIMGADCGTRAVDAKQAFAMGVDMLLQVGNVRGSRRLIGVWRIPYSLKDNDVQFEPLYQLSQGDSVMRPWTEEQFHWEETL